MTRINKKLIFEYEKKRIEITDIQEDNILGLMMLWFNRNTEAFTSIDTKDKKILLLYMDEFMEEIKYEIIEVIKWMN